MLYYGISFILISHKGINFYILVKHV